MPFESWTPAIDESPHDGETPRASAARLARKKAEAAAARFKDAWIIGSDQVAESRGTAIGKPGTLENARRQLGAMSGETVRFHTAVCLLSPGGAAREQLVTTEVAFRTSSDDEIARYLARESVLDVAGSAKSEGLGIALLERARSDDPTALVGLPLIALAAMLRAEGFEVP